MAHIPEMIQKAVELPMPRAYIRSLDPQNRPVLSMNPMINIPAISTIQVKCEQCKNIKLTQYEGSDAHVESKN